MAESRTHPAESMAQLKALGIPVEVLEEALLDGHNGRKSTGPLHPRWFAGSHQYADTVEGLRVRLMGTLKWKLSEERGFATVVSPDGSFQIAVSSADARVGTEESPRTKNPKGEATAFAVMVNRAQGKLFASLPTFLSPRLAKKSQAPSGLKTWFLLYHQAKDHIAFELSLPKSIGADGRPNAWEPRFKFAPLMLNKSPRVRRDSTPTKHEVDVSRR